jgi:hypothetical protein
VSCTISPLDPWLRDGSAAYVDSLWRLAMKAKKSLGPLEKMKIASGFGPMKGPERGRLVRSGLGSFCKGPEKSRSRPLFPIFNCQTARDAEHPRAVADGHADSLW